MTERLSERRYRGLPPEVRQADRRRRFREAGLDVFSDVGYMSSSVPEICRVAGLSTRQFYEEFTSREGLLLDLYQRINEDARSLVSQAMRQVDGEDVRAHVRAGVTAYIHAMGDDPRRARLALTEAVGVNRNVDQERGRQRAEWTVLIETAGRELLPAGSAPLGGFHTAMVAYAGAVNAVVADWAKGEPRAPIGEVTDVLVPLLIAVLSLNDKQDEGAA
ncbi:TetR/AcrR family transcriptional regulator [Tomitella gaofuii]|uniref:TetR/AcrR family transcriptional regulator n=1 Tax=Tomitella gaofuii TaxID=2760083 RepID=UPI0015FE0BB1|nr:TetR/AcrR family transcriptional regulator [Tomitella gaofuii]